MSDWISWVPYAITVLVMPLFIIGWIRKIKARLQNRLGPPVTQPIFDFCKLFSKGETVSRSVSWIFRSTAAINLAVLLVIAALVPWVSYKPNIPGSDLFLVLYMFALARFLTMLVALDSGSPFGAFAAGREATLSMLVEPAAIISLSSLAVLSHSSDLSVIFSISNLHLDQNPGVWIFVGSAILLSSLVELSRMPVDDPTTHLELTMVHEAMMLECSGRNLALSEFTQALRLMVLFGLSAQCYLHAMPAFRHAGAATRGGASIVAILGLATAVAVFEALAVKLQWRKVPEFIAYSLTMSLLAALLAIGGGLFG